MKQIEIAEWLLAHDNVATLIIFGFTFLAIFFLASKRPFQKKWRSLLFCLSSITASISFYKSIKLFTTAVLNQETYGFFLNVGLVFGAFCLMIIALFGFVSVLQNSRKSNSSDDE